jgi:hypothetical protein
LLDTLASFVRRNDPAFIRVLSEEEDDATLAAIDRGIQGTG